MTAIPTSHRHATPADSSVDLADLADDDWVWLPRRVSPDYHDELVAACRRYGFSPRATHTATSITSQLAMVSCGLGVTLVPNIAASQQQTGIIYREPSQHLELGRV